MSGVKIILGVILIKGFLLHVTHSQCSGTNKVIYPGNGVIQSPNYPNELGKAANCTWKFSSKGKEYTLVLTVVKLRLYFVMNGEKKCSGSYILKTNEDTVNCERYVDPSYALSFCNVYYSSDTCSIKQQGCEITKQTSFPVQVTYKSDGRTVQGHNGGAVYGFKIEYKYIECAPEMVIGKLNEATNQTNDTDVSVAEPSITIYQLTVATVIMGVVILTLLFIVAVLLRQRTMLLASSTAPDTTIHRPNIDTPAGVYDNEVFQEEPKHTYACITNRAKQTSENDYETPIPMREYENLKQGF